MKTLLRTFALILLFLATAAVKPLAHAQIFPPSQDPGVLRIAVVGDYGDGSQTRSFCYMGDLVEGLIRLMNSEDEVTGPVNLGNPNEFTIRQLAELVIELTGSASQLAFRPLPTDDPLQRQPDISRARELLAWEPGIELRQGLASTIDYFRAFLPA